MVDLRNIYRPAQMAEAGSSMSVWVARPSAAEEAGTRRTRRGYAEGADAPVRFTQRRSNNKFVDCASRGF